MRYLSLFSGIEAATQAWAPLGWHCVGLSEIEPAACAVLAARYPSTPNLGDVRMIGLCARYDPVRILGIAGRYTKSRLARYYIQLAERMESLGPIDLMVFGSPCQDLSVAGKRKGFNHEGRVTRSGLFHVAIDIARWARRRHGLRFALWENVVGAYTSNKGRDFAAVVDQMAGMAGTEVPPKGWGTEGCAVGAEAMVEWSTLDAQWFGVAQRRRRCFALADFGDWANRPPILLEPQGLRGHSAPSRGPGKEAAAGTLRSTGGGSDVDHACAGHLQPVAATLDASYGRLQGASGQDLNHGHSHLVPLAYGGNNQAGSIDVATARNACGSGSGRMDFETETFLVQAICFDTTQITSAANRSNPKPGDPCHPLMAAGHPPAIAFDSRQDCVSSTHVFGALGSSSPQAQAVCITGDITHTLKAEGFDASEDGTGRGNPIVPAFAQYGMAVRRLTPRECERLQGMVDDHTLVTYRGKPMKDGPRYKCIGNSMARVVMEWIGRSIDRALLAQFFSA